MTPDEIKTKALERIAKVVDAAGDIARAALEAAAKAQVEEDRKMVSRRQCSSCGGLASFCRHMR
jgi:hypothetical protein